jgi:hypothetical protein
MSTQPVKKKIKLQVKKGDRIPFSEKYEKKEIKFKEPEIKKRDVSISPQAEIVYNKYLGGDKGGVNISASKSIPTGRSSVDVSGSYKGVGGSARYSPSDKTLDASARVQNKKGAEFGASKYGNRYSASYTSPSGKSISIGSDKDINVSSPTKKGGFVSASFSPRGASGSLTTKKGNTFNVDYNKENKSFSVGARLNIKKKK